MVASPYLGCDYARLIEEIIPRRPANNATHRK